MASPQNKSQVPAGTVLEGKFRITREIGRGGMAAVYEAENIALGKRVAVKILAAELITSRIVRERFQREARAAAAIRSPYICDVYDSGMFDNRPFLVMELLEGESLYDLMTRVRRIDVETTLSVIVQTAKGLQKAHEVNVIHRDLKPENIFLTRTPEGELLVKLVDFGLAKFYEQTPGPAHPRLTREGALFGTPAYMSPEQAKGQGEVDHRADLWALGCIAYECLTAVTVWNVDQGVAMILAQIAGAPIPKPSKLRPDLPPAFDQWFAKCLERDPAKRFQTAKELSDALIASLDPSARSSSPSWRQSPTPSAEESAMIDELVESSATAAPNATAGVVPHGAMPPPPAAPVPAMQSAALWRALTALLAVATLALGAYAVWLYGMQPQGTEMPVMIPPSAPPSASAAPRPSSTVGELDEPLEKDAYAVQISQAQVLLKDGQRDEALAAFKAAFNNGGSGVARGLLNHAAAALPSTEEGKCRVTGLGRPRPFERTSPSSRPSVAVTPAGIVTAWVDNQQEATRRQAFTSLVDAALRRVSPARLVTPEVTSARHPQLLPTGDKLVLLYWEETGNEAGVYVRMLEPDGRIAGPQKRVSDAKRDDFYPSIARAPDGSLWVAWSQETESGRDLFTRHLSAELEPLGASTRLTAFGIGRDGHGAQTSRPALVIDEGELVLSFTMERDRKRRVFLLQIGVQDPALTAGASPDTAKGRKRPEDRVVGKLSPVSTVDGKHDDSRVVCETAGCYVVWNDEKGGALAAYVDRAKSQALWNREFSRGGLNPTIAISPTGAMVAYYEGSRVKITRMTRDGLEEGSVVGKVGGAQPYPAISAGNEPGQWYISWRDYESGHLEAYVVRAQCK